MTDIPHYEPGMRVSYDAYRKTVTVTFRGRAKTLMGIFTSEEQARRAGEAYCRVLGWNPKIHAVAVRSLLSSRRGPERRP
ncbi:MAG: hypothetical protein AB7E79_15495 [Rhodospirillaceae bacterium]